MEPEPTRLSALPSTSRPISRQVRLSAGMAAVGAQNTAKVISWNGIASYGAIAIGAPLGVLMVSHWGMWSMGASIIALATIGLLLAWPKRAAPIVSDVRLPFLHVLGRVLPHGAGLALGSIGFGTIATFITLYYATPHRRRASRRRHHILRARAGS